MKAKSALKRGFGTVWLILLLGSCGGQSDQYISKERIFTSRADEAFYGLWLSSNIAADDRGHQKFINYPWGYIEVFKDADDKLPEARGTYALVHKRTDKEGNVWYISVDRYEISTPGVVRYTLTKISEGGNKYEEVSDPLDVPSMKDLNLDNYSYGQWHRR